MLHFSKKNHSKTDSIVILVKIAVFIFVAIYLFGNFIPFYEGNDSYTLATIAIKISNGEYIDTNELLEKTNRFEFIPGDWAKSLDDKLLSPINFIFFLDATNKPNISLPHVPEFPAFNSILFF